MRYASMGYEVSEQWQVEQCPEDIFPEKRSVDSHALRWVLSNRKVRQLFWVVSTGEWWELILSWASTT